MSWIEIPLAEIEVDAGISYLAVEEIRVDSVANQYAYAEVILQLGSVLPDVTRLKNQTVIMHHKGKILFCGICIGTQVAMQGGIFAVKLMLTSFMREADKEVKNKTYQNPEMTFNSIVKCLKEYNIMYSLENDFQIGKVVTQKNQTDFQFIVRLANQNQLTVFDIYNRENGFVYIGTEGYKEESIGEKAIRLEEGKCLEDMRYDLANQITDKAEYEYRFERVCSHNISLMAGCRCELGIVLESHIYSERGVVKNEVLITQAEAVLPNLQAQRREAFASNIVTGEVDSVDVASIKVLFDSDAGGGMTDIPYESVFSNSFYTMPDEKDKVFVYLDNQGSIVCLGSKRTDVEDTMFDLPAEKSLGNPESLIHFPESDIVISATREEYSLQQTENQVIIRMQAEAGIAFNAPNKIAVSAEGKIVLGAVDRDDHRNALNYIEYVKANNLAQNASKKEEESQKYVPLTTVPHYDLGDFFTKEGFGLRASNTWDDVKTSFVEGGKGLIFWDWWHGEDPVELNTDLGDYDKGKFILGAYNIEISVANVSLRLGVVHSDTIEVYAATISWFGSVPTTNYPIKQDELRDAWEIFMDAVVAVLAIAATAVAIAGLFVATGGTALIVAGVALGVASAAVAFARDDYFGAFTSLVGAIAGGFGELFGTGTKLAKLLENSKKITSVLQLVYGLGQTVYVLPKAFDQMIARINAQDTISGKIMEFQVGALNLFSIVFSNVGDAAEVYSAYHPRSPISGGNNSGDGGDGAESSTQSRNNSGNGGDGTNNATPVDAPKTTQGTRDGDPVDVATGALTENHTDLRLKDVNGDFVIRRTYQSTRINKGRMLGDRWLFNFECCLWQEAHQQTCTVYLPDDHNERFVKDEKGLWRNATEGKNRYHLETNEDGFCLKDRKKHFSYYFNSKGYIQFMTDPYGNRTCYEYDGKLLKRITLESGLFVELFYQGTKLTLLTDGNGRKYEYSYDGELLESVKYPNGGILRYEYTPEGYIQKIHNENGKVYLNNRFDRKGRVIFQTTADGEEYTFFYNDRVRETTVTKSGLNRTVRYRYDSRDLVEQTIYEDGSTFEQKYDVNECIIYEKDCLGRITERSYNEFGLLTAEKLPNGLVRQYEYGENGKCIREYDNAGTDKAFVYNEKGILVSNSWKIDEQRTAVYQYQYDQHGRMIEKTYPDQTVESWEYDAPFVHPTYFKNAEQNEIRYELDEQGRKVTTIHHDGEIHYAYNSYHHLTMVEDEEHHVTRYTYDLTGQRTGIKLPEDVLAADDRGTSFRYDEMDHLLEVEDACGIIYRREVDSEGKIRKSFDPVSRDAISDEGAGITYQYDANGYRTHTIYQDGSVQRCFYDKCGNLLKIVEPEEYDAAKDDGPGRTFTYDVMNRVVTETDLSGRLVRKNTYDLSGNIIGVMTDKMMALSEQTGTAVEAIYRYNNAGWCVEERIPVKEENGTIYYRVRTFAYDVRGNVTAEKRYLDYQERSEAKGRVLLINKKYDRLGRLIHVNDSLGAMIEYAYNERNKLTAEKSKISEKVYEEKQYTYTPGGKLHTVSVVMGKNRLDKKLATTVYQYNPNGLVTEVVSPSGSRLDISYDRANKMLSETLSQKNKKTFRNTTYQYDLSGRLCGRTTNGKVTAFGYDIRGRRNAVCNVQGKTTAFVYDRNNRIVRQINPKQYDAQGYQAKGIAWIYKDGRLAKTVNELTHSEQEFTYNAFGENTGIKVGSMEIEKVYDLGGRCTQMRNNAGLSSQRKEYDPWNHVTKVVDGNGNETEFELDLWGRISKVRRADGGCESYSYDFAGNVSEITDGRGNVTCFEYNEQNLLAKRTDPFGAYETWQYDEEGRPDYYCDRSGNEIAYSYNAFGQLTSKKALNGSGLEEIYAYTDTGLLDHCIGGGMRYDYSYDGYDRLTAKKASGRMLVSYEYNEYDELVSQADISGKKTEYLYDALGRMIRVTDNGAEQAAYEYDALGRLVQKTGGLLQSVYDYDGDGNISTLKTVLDGKALIDNRYRYDGNGNLTRLSRLDKEISYGYDSMNRINSAVYPEHVDRYAYDYADNRISRMHFARADREILTQEEWLLPNVEELLRDKELPEGSMTGSEASYAERYVYDAANRLAERSVSSLWEETAQEVSRYEYDPDGNLLTDGETTYAYDAFHRTTEIRKKDGNSIRNTYDAEGLRAELEENGKLVRFLYSGEQVIAEEEESGQITRYVRGIGLISSDSESARTYYHYVSDEKGSITDIVSGAVRKKLKGDAGKAETAEVLNHYEYDEFGNLLASEEQVGNRFLYTGEIYDAVVGQYYLRARFYNPLLGRFNQEDDRYDDGLNLYAYCRNNPVMYADPSGHGTNSAADRYLTGQNDGGVPSGYFQDRNGRWHRPNGQFASNAEVGITSMQTTGGQEKLLPVPVDNSNTSLVVYDPDFANAQRAIMQSDRTPVQYQTSYGKSSLKFGDNDLVYGPSANRKLAELKESAGGKLLSDVGNPYDMGYSDWLGLSLDTIENTVKQGNYIHFDLTYMQDIDGILNGTSQYMDRVTSGELIYIRDNWDRFSGNIKFYNNGKEVLPPWMN